MNEIDGHKHKRAGSTGNDRESHGLWSHWMEAHVCGLTEACPLNGSQVPLPLYILSTTTVKSPYQALVGEITKNVFFQWICAKDITKVD